MSDSIKENILKIINGIKEKITLKNNMNTKVLKEELIDDILSLIQEDNNLYKLLKENENNIEEQYNIIKNNIDIFNDEDKIIINETIRKIDNIDNLKKQTVEKVKNVANDENINKILEENKNNIDKQFEDIRNIIEKIDSKYNDEILQLKKIINVLSYKIDICYPIAFITLLTIIIIIIFTL
jgi:DNA repair exonuclease SbcCD ATPase subunit